MAHVHRVGARVAQRRYGYVWEGAVLPHHVLQEIWTFVHREDDCNAGSSGSIDWMNDALAKKCEIKTQKIGEGKNRQGEDKEKTSLV